MYNRNYGGFNYVRIHSELLTTTETEKQSKLIPPPFYLHEGTNILPQPCNHPRGSGLFLTLFLKKKRRERMVSDSRR